MKKAYVMPQAEIEEFQLEDMITSSGTSVTVNGGTGGTLAAASRLEGIGSGNTSAVVEFDFSDLS